MFPTRRNINAQVPSSPEAAQFVSMLRDTLSKSDVCGHSHGTGLPSSYSRVKSSGLYESRSPLASQWDASTPYETRRPSGLGLGLGSINGQPSWMKPQWTGPGATSLPMHVVVEFIQNPTGPASEHPVIMKVIKNILHKNLVLRLRTGAVRQYLNAKYGDYFEGEIRESPVAIAQEILSSNVRERVVYDIKKNMRDNVREEVGISVDAKMVGYPLFDALSENVQEGTEIGELVLEAIEEALTQAVCEEIKDAANVACVNASYGGEFGRARRLGGLFANVL